jgi:hypothetical protein
MTPIVKKQYLDVSEDMCPLNDKKLEKLAYWYFRLNGFLTIENFVVHPDRGPQCTEADLLATRFPYRYEAPNGIPMEDDPLVILDSDRIQILLVEVKACKCDLNLAWIDNERRNMQRIISAIGPFKDQDVVNNVSENLYKQGWCEHQNVYVSLCCFGLKKNQALLAKYRKVPQITLKSVLPFIHQRFYEYRVPKGDHKQWDEFGKMLWQCVEEDFNGFRDKILKELRS